METLLVDFSNPPKWFCPSSDLSLDDQKWIWDNIPHTDNYKEYSGTVDVNGDVFDTCKLSVTVELTFSNYEVVNKLRAYTHKTSPKIIAKSLEKLFKGWETKDGWWLYVAQHWNPREINRTITHLIKIYEKGLSTIRNPARYFTYLIKLRKKRKKFRSSNDTYKQKD